MNATGYKPTRKERIEEEIASINRDLDEVAAKRREAARERDEKLQGDLDRHLGTK